MNKPMTSTFLIMLFTLFFYLFALPVFAAKPLPADQAFAFSLTTNEHQVKVKWNIAPGYYLYRDKVHIDFEPKIKAEVIYPAGILKKDGLKKHEVYMNTLIIPIMLETLEKNVQIKVAYQGCSEKGFCYPPMHQTLSLNTNNPIAITSTTPETNSIFSLLTDQGSVEKLFATQKLGLMLLIFMGLGLLLAFTPCVLPMIPILTGIIVGQKNKVTTRKAFRLSLAYVFGASITYAFAGLLAASMGGSLQAWLQQTWIIILMSGLFLIFAFSLFGFYDINLPRSWQNRITSVSRKQQGGTYVGVFIMGMVSTLIVSPCVTAPLVGVLMYIAQTGDKILGASALFAMGIGMGIPLIAIGTSAGKLMPRRGPWMDGVKKLFGVLMLGMAIWMGSRAPIFHFSPVHPQGSFLVVHNVDELNTQIAKAAALKKPIMLDFYADWCESCISMDKNVFNTPAVKDVLKDFVILRADLTANTLDDDVILKKFAVIAPPTILFFNHYGKEVNHHRIVGELNRQEFMTRLQTFLTASCDKKLQC